MSAIEELTEAVTFEVRGHYAIITINRPQARNAVNGAVANGIEAGIDRLEEDDDLWVGIITGVPPVFCAGADLKEINSGNAGALQTKRGGFGGIVHPAAGEADDRRRRRPRAGRRHRDHPRLRPHRRLPQRHLRRPRGQAQPGGGGRRALPPRAQDPPQHRHGVRPHRRPDQRRAGPPVRPRERAVRRGPGARGGDEARRPGVRQRPHRRAGVPQGRPRGHERRRRGRVAHVDGGHGQGHGGRPTSPRASPPSSRSARPTGPGSSRPGRAAGPRRSSR